MSAPLEGIKVLDLTRLAPGPYCTMILGDLGADVLRIEETGVGGRRSASPQDQKFVHWLHRSERSAAYNALGRNKRSIALNLKMEEARQIFYRLAQGADVVVEEFRPGVVKRLGVDYETVSRLNPRIVYCSITGYGQSGPYWDRPGHDINYISFGGALGLIGEAGGRPAIPLNLLADYAGGGMNAVIGILSALLARGRTGRGQYIDIAMADGVVNLMAAHFSMYLTTGALPRRGEDRVNGGWPEYSVYETKDGKYLSLGCLEPWFFESLFRALGREDLIPLRADESKRGEIRKFLESVMRTKTRDEWYELFSREDICVGKVYTLDEVLADPQVQHRDMVVEVEHPTLGKVKQVGIAVKLSETPGHIRRTAPLWGEHTDEVLKGLGYSPAEIQSLREKGAIK